MKILLANLKVIDVTKRSIHGNVRTAAEIARRKGKEQLADLIDEYEQNPKKVMMKMREELC